MFYIIFGLLLCLLIFVVSLQNKEPEKWLWAKIIGIYLCYFVSIYIQVIKIPILIIIVYFIIKKKSKLNVNTKLLALGFSLILYIAINYVVPQEVLQPIYGNNRESIIECIKRDPIIKDKNNFAIADIVDTDKDTRVVGFFSSGGTGVATFIKDKDNNYKMEQREIQENTMTAYFTIVNPNALVKKLVVVSNGSDLDKIEIIINGKYKKTKDNLINKSSVSVFDIKLPKNEAKDINIDFKFLDVNGNEWEIQ